MFRGLYLNINVGINAGGLLFIDGAPVVGGYSPSIVDTERVEILKGPQSAYFGRSTFVGALNFVMKEPGNEFGGRVSADFASFGSNEQHVMVEAFVQNALDHDEFLQGALSVDLFTFIRGPNKNEVRVSAPIPRTFGIRLAYNF